MVELDLQYISNRCLYIDIKIIRISAVWIEKRILGFALKSSNKESDQF